MKKISEMSTKELLELTNEEIEDFVHYEAAMQGVPLLLKPKQPEYEKIPEAEHIWYESNLFSGIVFPKIEAAEALYSLAMELGVTNICNYPSAGKGWTTESLIINNYQSEQEHQITRTNLYTRSEAISYRKSFDENSNKKSKYEEAMRNYEKKLKGT